MINIIRYNFSVQDQHFKDKVNGIIGDLLSSISGLSSALDDGATVITTAIELAKTNYNKAKEDFDGRRSNISALYKPLHDTFNGVPVTPALDRWLNETKDVLKTIESKLRQSDLVEADRLIVNANALLKKALRDHKSYILSVLELFDNSSDFLPPDVIPVIETLLKKETAEVKVKVDALADPADVLADQVQSQNEIQTDVNNLADSIIELLQKKYQALADDNEEFKKRLVAWESAIKAIAENPVRKESAEKNWDPDLLSDLIRTRNSATGSPGRMGDKNSSNEKGILTEKRLLIEFSNEILPMPFTPQEVENIPIKDIAQEYRISASRYLWLNILQIIILSLIVGLSAVLMYGPKFFGTFADLGCCSLLAFHLI